MPLHPDIDEYAAALRELEAHLSEAGEAFWSKSVGQCASLAEKSDYRGVEQYLGLFGGMGSLNDLILQRDNHWLISQTEQFEAIRGRAANLANVLREGERARATAVRGRE